MRDIIIFIDKMLHSLRKIMAIETESYLLEAVKDDNVWGLTWCTGCARKLRMALPLRRCPLYLCPNISHSRAF